MWENLRRINQESTPVCLDSKRGCMKSSSLPQNGFWLRVKNVLRKNRLWINLHSVKVSKKANASRRGKKRQDAFLYGHHQHTFAWGKRKESRLPDRQSSTPILDGQRRSRIYGWLSQNITGLWGQLVRENERTKKSLDCSFLCISYSLC